jgi:hypothetical protein
MRPARRSSAEYGVEKARRAHLHDRLRERETRPYTYLYLFPRVAYDGAASGVTPTW